VVFEGLNNLLLPAKVAFSVNSWQLGHKWMAPAAQFGHSNMEYRKVGDGSSREV
jgi:hypothetical protein